jgi:hypothetical protein
VPALRRRLGYAEPIATGHTPGANETREHLAGGYTWHADDTGMSDEQVAAHLAAVRAKVNAKAREGCACCAEGSCEPAEHEPDYGEGPCLKCGHLPAGPVLPAEPLFTRDEVLPLAGPDRPAPAGQGPGETPLDTGPGQGKGPAPDPWPDHPGPAMSTAAPDPAARCRRCGYSARHCSERAICKRGPLI